MANQNPLKQRIVGAIVLISLAVIFVPLVLDRDGPILGASVSNIPKNRDGSINAIEFELNEVTPGAITTGKPAEVTTEIPLLKDFMDSLGLSDSDEAKPEAGNALPEGTDQAYSWMVQIATFSDEANAIVLRDKLRKKGFSTHVDKITGAKGDLWRIRVGPELTSGRAEALSQKLAKETGLKPLVVRVP